MAGESYNIDFSTPNQDLGSGTIDDFFGYNPWFEQYGFSPGELGSSNPNRETTDDYNTYSGRLNQWLSQNKARVERTNTDNSSGAYMDRFWFNDQPTSLQKMGNYGNEGFSPLQMALLSSVINPIGGAAAGGATGGLGGQLASGSGAKAINAGLNGTLSSLNSGGNALTGGTLGALGAYGPNYGSYLGVDNPTLQNAVNGGITGGLSAAGSGGNVGASVVTGAVPSLASYFGSSGGAMDSPLGKNYSTIPGLQQSNVGEITGNAPQQSFAGWAGNEAFGPTVGQEKQGLFESTGLNDFFNGLQSYLPSDGKGWGDMAQGLAGIYQGYKQRKNAESVLNAISGRRGGYEKNLRASLMARDAASGRRSNYEGREAQLQAELAKLDMGNAPLIANLSNASTSGLVGMLSSGLRWGGKAGLFGDSYNPNVPTVPAPVSFNSMPAFSLSGMGSNPLTSAYGAPEQPMSLIDLWKRQNPNGGQWGGL